MSYVLAQLHEDIAGHLSRIEKLFKPVHKLTLFCRNPLKDNQECMLTGEDPDGDKKEQFEAIVGFAAKLFNQSDLLTRIKSLEDQNAKLREAVKWLPIESLNKAEMQFVLVHEDGAIRAQLWNPRGFWEDGNCQIVSNLSTCGTPTHWMPLPPLPELEPKEKSE